MSALLHPGEELQQVLDLGQAIQARIEAADLESAEELAIRRLDCLKLMFRDSNTHGQADMAAYWLQEILREDRELISGLEKLRLGLEHELGELRNASRSAREYAEVQQG